MKKVLINKFSKKVTIAKHHYAKPLLILFISLLATQLYAMSPKPTEPVTSNKTSVMNILADQPLNEILPRYHWRLSVANNSQGEAIPALFPSDTANNSTSNVVPPIELNFIEQRLTVTGTCNQQMAGFTIEPSTQQISVGQIAQTMRACIDTELALKDDAMIALLTNLKESSIQQTSKEIPPQLTLRAANGDTFIFDGVLTPEARFGQPGEIIFLEVAPQLVECALPTSPQCLQIREVVFDENWVRSTPNEAWISYPNFIEGYTHQQGIRNLIRVKRFSASTLDVRLIDMPDTVYVLDMVIEASNENP